MTDEKTVLLEEVFAYVEDGYPEEETPAAVGTLLYLLED